MEFLKKSDFYREKIKFFTQKNHVNINKLWRMQLHQISYYTSILLSNLIYNIICFKSNLSVHFQRISIKVMVWKTATITLYAWFETTSVFLFYHFIKYQINTMRYVCCTMNGIIHCNANNICLIEAFSIPY